MIIRIHDFVPRTRALGPYERFAIWFQGCNRRCTGCMSPETRDVDSGHLMRCDDVYNIILKQKDIEGITISRGEPFLQIDGLYELLSKIHEGTSLGVIVYTGYTISELKALECDRVNEMLDNYIDILIDGIYIEELNDDLSLRGSSNQNVIFLTERYLENENLFMKKGRSVEVRVKPKNIVMVGVPTKEILVKWNEVTNKT